MTFIHVYSYYNSPDAEEQRRINLARQTWAHTYKQGDWVPLPVMDETLPRMFSEGNRKLPMIRDLISEALDVSGNGDDYIVLTNSDTCFAPSMHHRIADWSLAFKPTLPICSNRKDFNRLDKPLTDQEVMDCGNRYPGIDLFVFQKDWWLSVVREFPDMVLGREAWDAVLWLYMKARGGYSIDNLIYHENHNSAWQQPHNRYTLAGQIYNLTLVGEWARKCGIDVSGMGIRDVPSYWEMPLPTSQETPIGGWRFAHGGIYVTHPYAFEEVLKNAKRLLRESNMQIPADLKEIILKQSHGLIGPTFSS